MKTVVGKAIHAFQLTDEYNAILFGWYFKGFELLKRYLIKHGPGTDLEDLDFKAICKRLRRTRWRRRPRLLQLLARILQSLRKTKMTLLQHTFIACFFFFFSFFFLFWNALPVLGLLNNLQLFHIYISMCFTFFAFIWFVSTSSLYFLFCCSLLFPRHALCPSWYLEFFCQDMLLVHLRT